MTILRPYNGFSKSLNMGYSGNGQNSAGNGGTLPRSLDSSSDSFVRQMPRSVAKPNSATRFLATVGLASAVACGGPSDTVGQEMPEIPTISKSNEIIIPGKRPIRHGTGGASNKATGGTSCKVTGGSSNKATGGSSTGGASTSTGGASSAAGNHGMPECTYNPCVDNPNAVLERVVTKSAPMNTEIDTTLCNSYSESTYVSADSKVDPCEGSTGYTVKTTKTVTTPTTEKTTVVSCAGSVMETTKQNCYCENPNSIVGSVVVKSPPNETMTTLTLCNGITNTKFSPPDTNVDPCAGGNGVKTTITEKTPYFETVTVKNCDGSEMWSRAVKPANLGIAEPISLNIKEGAARAGKFLDVELPVLKETVRKLARSARI